MGMASASGCLSTEASHEVRFVHLPIYAARVKNAHRVPRPRLLLLPLLLTTTIPLLLSFALQRPWSLWMEAGARSSEPPCRHRGARPGGGSG